MVQSIPNALTASRALAAMLFPTAGSSLRMALLLYAVISDLIDGEVGRRLGATSKFGRLFDPIADKIFVLTVAGTYLWDETLGWWELLLVASRDFIVILIAAAAILTKRRRLLANSPLLIGKLATAGQFIFLAALLFAPELRGPLLVIVGLISLTAAVAYLYDAVIQIRDSNGRATATDAQAGS